MTRSIKFRAWNKDWKMMVQPEDIISLHVDGVTNCVVDIDFNITTTDGQRHKNTWEDTEDLVLMQFTGLLDKNGVEIYFGDKLRVADSVGMEFVLEDWLKDSSLLLLIENGTYKVEIVGNIYENKRS